MYHFQISFEAFPEKPDLQSMDLKVDSLKLTLFQTLTNEFSCIGNERSESPIRLTDAYNADAAAFERALVRLVLVVVVRNSVEN